MPACLPRLPLARWWKSVALLVLAHFCAAIALAASPALHEHFHHDAAGAHHDCAATLLATHALDVAAPPAVCPLPVFPPTFLLALTDLPDLELSVPGGARLGRAPPRAS